ncbi:serine hydrolase [Thermodesulfobacteriota bacterium]
MLILTDTNITHSNKSAHRHGPERYQTVAALLLCTLLLLLPAAGNAKRTAPPESRYDVLYIWDNDLNNLLDYKEELEDLLGAGVSKKLRLIESGDRFGIIYDRDGTALSSAKVAIHHNTILNKAGMGDARAIKDDGYHELFNVCYGHGPNLAALKRHYQTIYHFLGAEVGKNLYIEQTDDGNYTLIYRRQSDRQSTMAAARRHAKLLRKKGIKASITREENNEVVFGESSHLDDEEKDPATPAVSAAIPSKPSRAEKTEPAPHSSPTLSGSKKKPIKEKTAGRSRNQLEKQLENYIKESRRKGKVAKDEKTGWLVIDLTRGETLVDINVDSPYQAASMIKPFIALAFFHKVKEGRLIYGPKSRRKMAAMIQRSSNTATNWVLKQVGGPKAAQRLLQKHYSHLLHETSLVEYIPSNGRTYRNKASAKDYGRFLVALWKKELPSGKELRRLMALPGRDRLYSGTPIPQGTLVYNKTGSTAKLCGDMGILAPRAKNGRRYPYIVVGIIEKQHKARNYGRWKMVRSNVIRGASSLIYKEMKQHYNLL